MRPGLRAEHCTQDADSRRAFQFVRLWRDERHARLLQGLSDSGILRALHLRPSWRLAVLIVAAHLLAAFCILAVSTSGAALALAVLVLALGFASAWDRALLRAGQSPRSLEISTQGRLDVRLADGSRVPSEAARVVNRLLVALILRNRKRNSVLIVAGMLAPEEFRRLRVWALWGRLPGVAPAQLPG
ncbi:MAG TPA: protein YgfX [Burkholderiales bacterium]|nr:protein YgfX [Burkholderiales bacterium]